MNEKTEYPRVLYLSDVTPDLIPGNSAMYRLLENYPAERLRILLGNIQPGRPDVRLQGPRYDMLRTARFPRLMRTRLAPIYAAWLYAASPWKAGLADEIVNDFRPQAIFTVAHTFGWLIADAVARRHRLPLHLAVWDDHVRQAGLPAWARPWAERQFRNIYRRAASRLCISPNMEEFYRQRFGVVGDVLYPCRPPQIAAVDRPRESIGEQKTSLTFAFAGSVNYGAYAAMLGTLSAILGDSGHRLLVFGGIDPELAKRSGINGDHVTLYPLLPIDHVLTTLHEKADVLFTPMTFEPTMENDMRISFPSKLTDYTAVGVPILIWGPPYCSAARWAKENPDAAVLVDTSDPTALAATIKRLADDGDWRATLANGAIAVGNRLFDHAAVTGKFHLKLIEAARIE